MKLIAYSEQLAEQEVLSVDGVAPRGPNLSHWPGNRTPERFRADTSTEMVLAALADAEGRALLHGELVTNNHYDTDGLLSVALVLQPKLAEDAASLRAAAWAGDLSRYPSREAVVLDLCIAGLNEHPDSPLAKELAGLAHAPRMQHVYDFALAHLDEIRAHPERFAALWEEPLEAIERSRRVLKSGGAAVAQVPDVDMVIVRSAERLHRVALREVAPRSRMLEIAAGTGEVVFTYAIDTWFDTVTLRGPPRHPLERLRDAWLAADPGARLEKPGAVTDLWPTLSGGTCEPGAAVAAIASALRRADAGLEARVA